MNRHEALAYRAKIEHAAAQQTDEDALQSIELFHQWTANEDVTLHQRVKDLNADGELTLYECTNPHHTQADWRPKDTPALWKVVSLEEWPEWRQPTGSQDSYNTGDKVSHNGSHWQSLVDGNVWEPSESNPTLWQKITQ